MSFPGYSYGLFDHNYFFISKKILPGSGNRTCRYNLAAFITGQSLSTRISVVVCSDIWNPHNLSCLQQISAGRYESFYELYFVQSIFITVSLIHRSDLYATNYTLLFRVGSYLWVDRKPDSSASDDFSDVVLLHGNYQYCHLPSVNSRCCFCW